MHDRGRIRDENDARGRSEPHAHTEAESTADRIDAVDDPEPVDLEAIARERDHQVDTTEQQTTDCCATGCEAVHDGSTRAVV